jgi:hypothetical protein
MPLADACEEEEEGISLSIIILYSPLSLRAAYICTE